MTGDERIVVGTLSNMSKALSRIADELAAIRGMLSKDQRDRFAESRKSRFAKEAVIGESSKPRSQTAQAVKDSRARLEKNSAMDNIRDIMDGAYVS